MVKDKRAQFNERGLVRRDMLNRIARYGKNNRKKTVKAHELRFIYLFIYSEDKDMIVIHFFNIY